MLKKLLPVVKDVLTAVIVILIIVAVMFAYTGVWPPMVVIESGSMMHDDSAYGKIGTIDPGDFTFVKKVNGRNDIVTYYQGERTGYKTYSNYGDVVVYIKNGVGGTPVIHRAMCWVEVNITENGTFYDVPELNYYHLSAITITELNLHNYNPNVNHSGFLTKGDHNTHCDQDAYPSIADNLNKPVELVKLEWIVGKAQGEIPWFGAIKLSVDDWSAGTNNAGNVAQDCWVMLVISVLILFILPISADYLLQLMSVKRQKKKEKRKIELDRLERVKYTIFRK